MGTDSIQAQYEQLEAIAARFGHLRDTSSELQQQVSRDAQVLIDGAWKGLGAAAFATEMQHEVFPAMQRLIAAFDAARTVTLEASAIFRRAEEDAARILGAENQDDIHSGTTKTQERPKPRIYIMNGINSDGNCVDKNGKKYHGDDDSVALEHLLEKYGYDKDQVKSTQAIYLKPLPEIKATNLSGTNLGGFLSPVDWVTQRGSSLVNTVTGWGEAATKGFNTAYGVKEVIDEYNANGQGYYTTKIYEEIAADLKANPLLPGQEVILVGHSGGGAVEDGVAVRLERDLDVDVNVTGLVTLGSPLSNFDEAGRYVETIVDIRHKDDAYAKYNNRLLPSIDNPNSITYNVTLQTPSSYPHGSYMHDDPGASLEVLEVLNKRFNLDLRLPR